MLYEKDGLKNDLIQNVKQTLVDYQDGVDTTNNGYNILRWAGQNLLSVKVECAAEACEMVMDWHPKNMGYVILRMAKKGMLEVKE